MLMNILAWIENTGVATWVRESVSLLAYPGILSLHTFGLAFVVGISAALCLRVLGFAPGVPLAPLRGFMPVLWAGFWVNAISGLLLLSAYATQTTINPIFVIKILLVMLAVGSVFALNREIFGERAQPASSVPTVKARRLAWTCLALWSAAIVTGRMTAYLDLVKGLF